MSSRKKGITADGRVDPALVVNKQLYNRTLKAVNAVRKAAGAKALKKLPFGQPAEPEACPLFFALESIGVESVTGYDMTGQIRLAPNVSFDLGEQSLRGEIDTAFGKVGVHDVDALTPDAIAELFDCADDFVDEFDDNGSEMLKKEAEEN